MLNGQTYDLSVTLSGNIASGDENGIVWQSADTSNVTVVPPSGSQIVLGAVNTGKTQTYITASHPKALSDKRILVLTADTQTELDAFKAIYTDTTYYRINVNG